MSNDVLNSLVITAPLSPVLSLARGVGGPQRQVVPQQLHYQGAVLVTVLVEGVQLGDGVVKGLNYEVISIRYRLVSCSSKLSPALQVDRPYLVRT